ncbi:MAG: patatin-like phospholipase family protein [Candidatus Aenigmatarchaeota archaeon]
MTEEKKIGLALSGGGYGGWVHLGVCEVLEREKIPIDIIVGTSAGGVVGLALACGLSVRDVIKHSKILKEKDFKRISDNTYGVFDYRPGIEKIRKIIGDKNIEDLPKKFAAVAVDITTGEEVVIDKGPAIKAIEATICIPGMFPPVEINGRYLVDGGLLNILPVDVCRNMGADVVIGVDVSKSFKVSFNYKPKKLGPFQKRIITSLRNPYVSLIFKRNDLINTIFGSVHIMGHRLRREKLEKYPPNVLIECDYESAGILDLVVDDKKYRNMLIERGKSIAESRLDDIRNLLN